jgi:hypothetical protein
MIRAINSSYYGKILFLGGFTMGVTRALINWCDTKFEEALHEEDGRKAGNKAFASGVVEGFMDAAVLMYIPVVIACYVWQNKANKK